MTQHTPGPWKIFWRTNDMDYTWPIVGIGEANGEGVVDCGFGVWRDGEEALANARLIAAAPDLLAALKGMLDHCALHSDDRDGQAHDAWINAQAAIARAEGKTDD